VTAFTDFAWGAIEGRTLTGDALHVRQAARVSGVEIVGGVDSQGRRHILVKLSEGMPDPAEQRTRGVSLRVRELTGPGTEPGRYIDIECQDPAGHAAFGLIGNEIIEAMLADGSDPGGGVSNVVDRWRRFWGQLPHSTLTVAEQIGLFAELWFLLMWLGSRMPLPEAVSRWRGPLGARHDFETPGLSVEVKASMATRGALHRVNGITQLEAPEAGELFIFSLQARNEDGARNSLPAIVAHGRRLAESDAGVAERFEDLLARAGYSALHETEYAKLRLRIVAEELYHVSQDFPRLTRESFRGGVPGGVEGIEYDINLGGFGHLLVASRPADGFPI
jgi:hypothetical protein